MTRSGGLKALLLLVCCVLSVNAKAQNETWQLAGGPYGSDIDTVLIASSHAIYMVTDKSTFFTSDQGTTWIDIHPPTWGGTTSPDGALWIMNSLIGMRWRPDQGWKQVRYPVRQYTERSTSKAFPRFLRTQGQSQYAYCTGDHLYLSTDDGATWTEPEMALPHHPQKRMEGVDFDGRGHAIAFVYADGSEPGNGWWFWSNDDGRTFTVHHYDYCNTSDVWFGADSSIYVYGLQAFDRPSHPLSISTDTAKTFKSLSDDAPTKNFQVIDGRPVYDISVAPYAACESFSFDLGRTWNQTFLAAQGRYFFFPFDSLRYLAVSRHVYLDPALCALYVIRSTANSQKLDTIAESKSAFFSMTAFASRGPHMFAFCGSDPSYGFFISHDDGTSWKFSHLEPTTHHASTICVDSSGVVYASIVPYSSFGIGPGDVFVSSDTGDTWSAHRFVNVLNQNIGAMTASRDTVFAAFDSALYKTTDHGASWETVHTFEFAVIHSLTASPVSGVLAMLGRLSLTADRDSCYISLDGGHSFQPTASNFRAPQLIGSDPYGAIWALNDTLLFRTVDAGQHWTQVARPRNHAAVFIDPKGNLWLDQGYNSGKICFSQTSGSTWDSCSTDGHDLRVITVTSKGRAFAATSGGEASKFGEVPGVFYEADLLTGSHSQVSPTFRSSSPLVLYPNPARDEISFTLTISEASSPSYVAVRILDLTGKTVRTTDMVSGSSIHIPLEGLPAGSYRILVRANGETQVTQFVVVR